MPADKFLSYSKFNKKYFNPYYLDNDLIPLNAVTYFLSETSLDAVQKQYQIPSTQHYSPSGYMTTFHSSHRLTDDNKVRASNMYDELVSTLPILASEFKHPYKIYPFDLDTFVLNYYPNTLPSEKSFIIEHMLNFNKIINRSSYLILSFQPFTKEEYDQIKNHWSDNYSISSIIKSLKQVQSVLDHHKKDLRHLLAANDALYIENKELKAINQDLSDQVYRSTFTNWS